MASCGALVYTIGVSSEIAAIDLGSNSFHMIIARLDQGRLTILDRMRERVRLGGGLDADGNLTSKSMQRALACLERFGQRVRELPRGSVRALGTNTLRKAKNGRSFINMAHDALGHPIEIIAGREEARLIYLGVAQTTASEGRRLVVDIGGGSTECIVGEGFEILDADSLYMGCVSYSERYFRGGVIKEDAFKDAEIAAQLELQSISRRYRNFGWTDTLGCSGTIHAIRRIVETNGWSDDGITRKSLKRLRKHLIAAGSVANLDLPGLAQDRKPVIAGGTAILRAVFENLRIDDMHTSAGALREGALYDLAGRMQHEDVRDRTIQWYCERYDVDLVRAGRVEDTAHALLDQVTEAWAMPEARASKLLSWASRLHEVGAALSHTAYHKHSAYIVENSDMAGFSRDDQRILAAIIMAHRRKIKSDAFAQLSPHRTEFARQLTTLFRIALALRRGRVAQDLPPILLRAKKDKLTLVFPADWLAVHPLTVADLEQEAQYLASIGYVLAFKEAS